MICSEVKSIVGGLARWPLAIIRLSSTLSVKMPPTTAEQNSAVGCGCQHFLTTEGTEAAEKRTGE